MPDAILMIINKYKLRWPQERLVADCRADVIVAMLFLFLFPLGEGLHHHYDYLGTKEGKGIRRPAGFSPVTWTTIKPLRAPFSAPGGLEDT